MAGAWVCGHARFGGIGMAGAAGSRPCWRGRRISSTLRLPISRRGWTRLVHLPFVQEVHGFFGGRRVVRLKDARRTELQVARERVAALKSKLGL